MRSRTTPGPASLTYQKSIKVSTESGPIQIGDRITSSSIPGVGMKATKDGYTVGIALESFDGENSTTTAKIHPTPPLLKEGDEQGSSSIPRPMAGMAAEGLATSSETKIVKTGKILVFVNLGYSKLDTQLSEVGLLAGSPTSNATNGWTIDQQTGKLTATFTGGLNFNNNSLENVSSILSANGMWSIDENGKLVLKEIDAEQVTTKRLQLKDEATGEIYCVKIVNSEWQKVKGNCRDD